MIRCLLISFLALFLLGSCSKYTLNSNFIPIENSSKEVQNTYFSDKTEDYVYKTSIQIYHNNISGILIAKKTNNNTHRVVFTTEFGNKLLDFEISETTCKVNSIVDNLNKKSIIKILQNDFQLLLKTNYQIMQTFQNDSTIVYQSQQNKKQNYLFLNKTSNKLSQIIQTNKRKEKINLYFSSKNNIFAEKIVIQHLTMPLKIELNHLITN